MAWLKRPLEDTEPRVQRLFQGPYRETGMGLQGLASAGLCVPRGTFKLELHQVPFRERIPRAE